VQVTTMVQFADKVPVLFGILFRGSACNYCTKFWVAYWRSAL